MSFCSLTKGITPKICRLCVCFMNHPLLNCFSVGVLGGMWPTLKNDNDSSQGWACRVARGKTASGVKRQTGILAKPRNIIPVTGLVSVARCLNRHFLVYGASSFSGKRSIFNWIFQHGSFIQRLFWISVCCTRTWKHQIFKLCCVDRAMTTCL